MPPKSALSCYADDTLVLVWGTAWCRTARLAELAVACVVAEIEGLGLRVSPEKSEAMWFYRKADHGRPPTGYHLRLQGAEIGVGTTMKYLGLTLDSCWTFSAHFERLAPSVEATANALGRPDDQPSQSPSNQEAAQDSGHQGSEGLPHHFGGSSGGALRVSPVRAPTSGFGLGGLCSTDGAPARAGAPGIRVLGAVLPNGDVCLDGGGPSLTYRVTQVLTGHGCFGEYLHRIGKEANARCHHCDASVDSAQHTLEYCPAWAYLIAEIGWDLSPPTILEALLVTVSRKRGCMVHAYAPPPRKYQFPGGFRDYTPISLALVKKAEDRNSVD
ncbi:uncharacterized protein LOC117209679 [Bombus bifarius]|uniref:Uncharacterized protein LOC117209679 n=1 Tax=Bombus bifarius TaxID=103933 RepID=A0A6P8MZR7_9HYME|nr:uncharacterized protein LOC117209679 [Bombus bifarius]